MPLLAVVARHPPLSHPYSMQLTKFSAVTHPPASGFSLGKLKGKLVSQHRDNLMGAWEAENVPAWSGSCQTREHLALWL